MIEQVTLKVKRLDECAVIPSAAHYGDIGIDVTAISMEYDAEKDMYLYHTGLAFEAEYGIGLFAYLRSSNMRTEANLCNHVGVIDCAIYRGETRWCFKNRTSLEVIAFMEAYKRGISDVAAVKAELDPMKYAPYLPGDRIGQLILMRHLMPDIIECDELSPSIRGENGFGSTGR